MFLMSNITWSILLVLGIVIGIIVGAAVIYFFSSKAGKSSIEEAKATAERVINDAVAEGENKKWHLVNEGKEEVNSYKRTIDAELKERKQTVLDLESKLNQREDSLERRNINLDRREENLNAKENKIDEKKQAIDAIEKKITETLDAQEKKLIEIAGISREEARNIIMTQVHETMNTEIAQYIKEEEERAKLEVKNKAKNVLALAIQKYASEAATENTVTTVALPVDEMKGRIIGREGRNIRAIESLTGVDLIIDDTPEAVVISGFDPVRREVAKRALEILVSDGRIHPARIEEVVERCRNEVEMFIREKGEEAIFETRIGKIHPDLVRLLGRLTFRTSYGQNVLKHSIETAMLAGKLASELGENEVLARRAGLLHDIGKAVDHEVEGSHVDIGVELANKYHEPKEVIDAIASHHEDVAPKSIIAVLVAAADALSSARVGARSDSLENYVKRLQSLEEISNSVKGVDSSYAIQAGREVRVIVNPEQVDDLSTITIARQIKEEIENKLSYPGTIKVTVIRETRQVEVAK